MLIVIALATLLWLVASSVLASLVGKAIARGDTVPPPSGWREPPGGADLTHHLPAPV